MPDIEHSYPLRCIPAELRFICSMLDITKKYFNSKRGMIGKDIDELHAVFRALMNVTASKEYGENK